MSIIVSKLIQGLKILVAMNKMPKHFREMLNFPINLIECLLYMKEKKITLGTFIYYHI